MLNSCDRLAMENSSSFCKNIHYYEYQARTALVSGEYELARKYLDMVDANWFEGKWVRRYRAFLDNPALMDADPEFRRLRPLLENTPLEFEAFGPLQEMINAHFANPDYINESVFKWQAASYLIQKDAERTLYCLFDRLEKFPEGSVGTALAEGALLFVSELDDPGLEMGLSSMLSDKVSVLERFAKFLSDEENARDLDPKKKEERFSGRYKGTYWYYYLFVDINSKR
jgi:hypothetical protein